MKVIYKQRRDCRSRNARVPNNSKRKNLQRHDRVAKYIHWTLCKHYEILLSEKMVIQLIDQGMTMKAVVLSYIFSNFTFQTIKTCHSYILLPFGQPYLSNFVYIYFTFSVILFYSNCYPLNCKDILKKLQRTISQQSANVLMNTHKFVTAKQGRKSLGQRKKKADTIRCSCQ